MNRGSGFDLLELQNKFFIELKAKGKVTNTLKNYRTDLNCFNHYLIDKKRNISMEGFTISDIEEYWQFLEQKYTSDNSKRRRLQALRIFFDYLIGKGCLSANPVRKLMPPPKFLDKPNPPSKESIQALWKHLLATSTDGSTINQLIAQRNQIIFLLIYTAALRVSDISRLTYDRIFLDRSPRILIIPPKRDPYSIPTSEIFRTIFLRYDALLRAAKRKDGFSFQEILFNANPFRILSGGLSPRGIELIFKGLRVDLGIEGLTARSLRQACIIKWLNSGYGEGVVKEWLGVAPNYSLKPYREEARINDYDDAFLINYAAIPARPPAHNEGIPPRA